MARLPKPGGDQNIWGDVLNEFLSLEHNGDGTHKIADGLAAKADDTKVVHTTGAETIAGTKTFSAPLVVPAPTAPEHALNKAYADAGFLGKTGGALAGDLSLSGHNLTDASAIRAPLNSGVEVRGNNDVPLLQIAADGTVTTKDTPKFNDLGYAVSLGGTANSNIGLGNKTYLDGKAWTYGGWFDFTARNTFLSDDGALFAYGFNVGLDKGYVIRLNGTTRQLQFFYGAGSTGFSTNTYCFDRKFLVFRFNGSDTLRINTGDTVTDTFLGLSPRTATGASYIGTRDNTGRFLAATVGNQFLYDRELSDREIYDIYHNKIYPTSAKFIYNLGERTGSIATDSSGAGNDGSLAGASYIVSPFGAVTKQPAAPARLEAALANADNRIAAVAAIGTSTTQGANTTAVNKRYANTLGAIWQRTFNIGGVGGFHTRALDWTLAGTGVEVITGLGISSVSLSSGATLTYTASCTGLELYYAQGAGQGSFTLTIDGGAPITITPNTSGTAGRQDGAYLGNTLASSSHTFVVTATNPCIINGAYFNNADRTTGVRLYNGGHGGFATSDFITSGADSQWVRLNTLAPAGVVLMITSNDFTGSFNPQTTKANVLIMVRKIKSIVTTNPDIVLVQQHRRFDYVAYGVASTYDQYAGVLKEIVAAEERVYYVDLSSLYPLANDAVHDPEDLMHTDNIHMTDAGHRFTAYCMARAFAPDLFG